MQKIFIGFVYSVACGGRFYFVCVVLFVTSQLDVIFMFPKGSFWRSLLTQYAYFLHALYLFHVSLHLYKHQRYRRKIHLPLRQSSSKLQNIRLRVKTGESHSSLRQSNLQLQNQAALIVSLNASDRA